MADFNPPSFSLGLDFDFEPLNHNHPLSTPTHVNPVTVEPGEKELEDDIEFQLRVSDSEPESPKKLSRNRLRRLRRGGSSSSKPISTPIISFVDDDIEDFSDEENARLNHLQAAQHHSRCSSSKLPLSGHGVLTRQQESVVNNKKVKHDSSCPSTSLGSSKGKRLFSDLSASPLRRFQLLDSESDLDEPPDNVYIEKNPSGANCNDKQNDSSRGGHEVPLVKNIDSLPPNSQKQDLWKDFSVNENHSVKTPVFDECFEEYFKTSKSTKLAGDCHKSRSNEQGKSLHDANKQLQQDLGPVPPSHYYFYHDDLRIQELVRSRLPHFFPLSSASDARHQSHNASSIDYMDQFGQEGAKQRNGKQVTSEKSAKKGRKRTKKSSVDDTLLDSGNWINPKQTANMPKDAGRRRVHAHGQSAGHWITAENGKKVYITKNGEELSGSLAYRHYRKESGKGFKKAKKKTTAKKK